MRRTLVALGVLLALALGVAVSASAGTSLTLTSPSQNSYQPTGTPTLSGADLQDGDTVTVNIYAGWGATGAPVSTASAQGANGKWSANTSLPSGTYTAVASETPPNGQAAQSTPVTFSVASAKPSLGLSLLSTDPVNHTASFSGTGTASQPVFLSVYAGSDTTASPVAGFQSTADAGGHFSVNATGLGNGPYTVVASQAHDNTSSFSPTVNFNASSALTMTTPAASGSLPQTAAFGGAVDTNPGVHQHVLVKLSRGKSTAGAGTTHNATIANGNWQLTWPVRLPTGTYTATATQPAATGQPPLTVTHTFTVTPPGRLSGTPTISHSGTVTAKLACQAGAGKCVGSLLVLNKRVIQPVKGGPKGPLRLLFRRYSVNAGKTGTVSGRVGGAQLKALKHAGTERLAVTNVYAVGSKLTKQTVTTAPVRIR